DRVQAAPAGRSEATVPRHHASERGAWVATARAVRDWVGGDDTEFAMKICFIYGAFSIGARPIRIAELETSKRGLTGSELSCFMYAKAMAERGHDVTLCFPGG